jgi:hypothetical protein
MAVVRTGPRDAESRTRDIGPAGSGVDGLSALGRLSALRVSDVVGDVAMGYGEIERRQATPDELARLSGPVAVPSRPAVASPSVAAGRRTHPEVPVLVPVQAAVPCVTCLHEPVCALKAQLAPYLGRVGSSESITEPAPGLRLIEVVRLERIECDHHLVAAAAPPAHPSTADRMATSRQRGNEAMLAKKAASGITQIRPATAAELAPPRQPGHHGSKAGEQQEKAERAASAIAAVARHGGDRRAAAAELGMRPNALAMVLKFADRHQATEVPA